MGFLISKLYGKLFFNKQTCIPILGIDGAGKTTIIYRLKAGEVIKTIPTIGFNVETFDYKGFNLTFWDLVVKTK